MELTDTHVSYFSGENSTSSSFNKNMFKVMMPLCLKLITTQIWFWNGLILNKQQVIKWTYNNPVHQCICHKSHNILWPTWWISGVFNIGETEIISILSNFHFLPPKNCQEQHSVVPLFLTEMQWVPREALYSCLDPRKPLTGDFGRDLPDLNWCLSWQQAHIIC